METCVDSYKIMDKTTMLAGGVAVSNFGFKFSQSEIFDQFFCVSVVNMQLLVKDGQIYLWY